MGGGPPSWLGLQLRVSVTLGRWPKYTSRWFGSCSMDGPFRHGVALLSASPWRQFWWGAAFRPRWRTECSASCCLGRGWPPAAGSTAAPGPAVDRGGRGSSPCRTSRWGLKAEKPTPVPTLQLQGAACTAAAAESPSRQPHPTPVGGHHPWHGRRGLCLSLSTTYLRHDLQGPAVGHGDGLARVGRELALLLRGPQQRGAEDGGQVVQGHLIHCLLFCHPGDGRSRGCCYTNALPRGQGQEVGRGCR